MKKKINISRVSIILFLLVQIVGVRANNLTWADSMFMRMEASEQLGQTIWLELESLPDLYTKNEVLKRVATGSIGTIIISEGNSEQIEQFINEVKSSANYPIRIVAKYENITSSRINLSHKLLDEEYLKSALPETIKKYGKEVGLLLRANGFQGYYLENSTLSNKFREKANAFMEGLKSAGISIITSENTAHLSSSVHVSDPQIQYDPTLEKAKKIYKRYSPASNYNIVVPEKDDLLVNWLNADALIVNAFDLSTLSHFENTVFSNKWYKRILELKTRKSLSWQDQFYSRRKESQYSDIKLKAIGFELMSESIVVAKNTGSLPFDNLEDEYAILKRHPLSKVPDYFRRYAKTSAFLMDDYADEIESLLTELAARDHIIVEYKEEDWNQNLKLLLDYLSMDRDITFLIEEKSGDISAIENYGNIVWTKSFTNTHLDLATQVLFGSFESKGKLPQDLTTSLKAGSGVSMDFNAVVKYTIPEAVRVDNKKLQAIDEIVAEAIEQKAFPGCQIAVIKDNSVIYQKGFGYFTYDSLFRVNNETIYDLASITKVASTLQAVMFLAEQNVIHLEDSISRYLPETIGTNKEGITIKSLLLHEAGLKAYLPFWKVSLEKDLLSSFTYNDPYDSIMDLRTYGLYFPTPREKSDIWQEILDSDLRRLKPGKDSYGYLYSDLGFMILQMLVEKITNQSLDQFVSQNLYEPLGLTSMTYNPLTKFDRLQIAPTEYDYYFRNAQIWGTVHDQNATILGGVAGHAGLFSNALDLAKLMQMNLNGGFYGKYKFIHEQTLNGFTEKQHYNNRRGLGWDKPDIFTSNPSEYASFRTFGHLGFTGTAVWVDPTYDLVYVFLSNRVYPSAKNRKLMENNIRTRIQDVVYEAIGAR